MNLEKWKTYSIKPFIYKKKEYNPLIWNDFGEECEFDENSKILIFMIDDKNNDFYYLNIDKIIDSNKIYIANLKNFSNFLIDNEKEINKNVKLKILDKIYKNIMMNNEINLSIVKIKNKDNKPCGESIFLGTKLFKENLDNYKKEYLNVWDETRINFPSFYSNKNSNSNWTKNRYLNGVDFCLKFLDEYCPIKINEFMKLQNIDKNYVNENFKKYNIGNFENRTFKKFNNLEQLKNKQVEKER